MRTLAGLGLLTGGDAQSFALTPLGEALRTGAPGAARASLLTLCSLWFVASFAHMMHSLRTGSTGFEKPMGTPVFDYLACHPEEASLFSETMINSHGAEPPAVAAAYAFSAFDIAVDVGCSI